MTDDRPVDLGETSESPENPSPEPVLIANPAASESDGEPVPAPAPSETPAIDPQTPDEPATEPSASAEVATAPLADPTPEPTPSATPAPVDAPINESAPDPVTESTPESGSATASESVTATASESVTESGEKEQRPDEKSAAAGGEGRPGKRPNGRPSPGRAPRPGAPGVRPPNPASATPAVAHASEPIFEPVDPHQWGRIDDEGVVYVYSASTGERPVGNWQAGDNEAGLAHFGRRFDDFVTEIALLETRLATGSGDPKATKTHAIELRESVDSLAAVGDFDSAAIRLEVVIGAADVAIAGASKARAAARSRAIAAKEALCVEAESLAESTAWKTTGDRLKAIVDEWRTIHGIDRKTDDALWKRFAKARDAFTRHRGTHFADLDKQRASAREAKEKLIARAEELSDSSSGVRPPVITDS